MTEDEKQKQAAVLAEIAKHKDLTVEEWNRQRFNIVIPETPKVH